MHNGDYQRFYQSVVGGDINRFHYLEKFFMLPLCNEKDDIFCYGLYEKKYVYQIVENRQSSQSLYFLLPMCDMNGTWLNFRY